MLEMSDREKFLFDLQGFLHVRQVLTPEEVKAMNDAIDANVPPFTEENWTGPNVYGGGMAGKASNHGCGGMLTWPQPWCQPFRDLLAHPRAIPYLNTIFGRGWKLDHRPGCIMARKGKGGHGLHGNTSRIFDGAQFYNCTNGQIRTGLTVFQYQLADINPGDGGITVIPGSHKANFKCPEDIMLYNEDKECVYNVACKAGDLVIFMEATIHGALPWTADHERRSLLYRYCPKYMQWAPHNYGEHELPEWTEELTDLQRAVLEPPYMDNRPLIEDDAETLARPAHEPKPYIPRKIHEM